MSFSFKKGPQFFHKMDSALFEVIKKVTLSDGYNQLMMQYRTLSSQSKNIILQVSSLILIIAPLLILSPFYLMVSTDMQRLKIKENLMESATNYLSQYEKYGQLKKEAVTIPISNKIELDMKIKTLLNRAKIDLEKIVITDFIIEESEKGGLQKIQFKIKFTDLNIREISNLASQLTNFDKFQINSTMMDKNDKELLTGEFSLFSYSEKNEVRG